MSRAGAAQGATSPAVAAEAVARALQGRGFWRSPLTIETAPFSQKKSWQGLVLWDHVIQGSNNKFQCRLSTSLPHFLEKGMR